jgi:hypothetical protein
MNIESIIGRRKFLKGAAIFSGLATLLGVVRPAAAGMKEPQAQPEHSSQGYRLTDHVKKYYETARP